MASHPDAARRGGARGPLLDGRRFVEASQAYQFLMGYLLSRPSHPHPARRGATERRSASEHGSSARRPGSERRGSTSSRGSADHHAGSGRATTGTRRTGAEKHGGPDRQAGPDRHSGSRRRAGPERHRGTERHAGFDAQAGAEKRATPEARTYTERRGGALYYRGPVPHRRLRLAEYLYYSGRVSWQSLISALVWQKASQPRFGELARDLRSISAQDLAKILGSRLRHEHTGEAAQRLQLLSAAQVERILRLQRARRRLIGRYFMEKESMSAALLTSLLHEMHRHNARWGG